MEEKDKGNGFMNRKLLHCSVWLLSPLMLLVSNEYFNFLISQYELFKTYLRSLSSFCYLPFLTKEIKLSDKKGMA